MSARTDGRPRRGRLYWVDLSPGRGAEPGKVRPALVLQTDLLNGRHPSTIIVPLTTKVLPGATALRVRLRAGTSGLSRDSDALVDQIRAIDARRLRGEIGAVPASSLAAVEEAVGRILDLPGR